MANNRINNEDNDNKALDNVAGWAIIWSCITLYYLIYYIIHVINVFASVCKHYDKPDGNYTNEGSFWD